MVHLHTSSHFIFISAAGFRPLKYLLALTLLPDLVGAIKIAIKKVGEPSPQIPQVWLRKKIRETREAF